MHEFHNVAEANADRFTSSPSRNQFLSKVAHELRTPLTIAKGWMWMLRDSMLTAEQARVVEVVNEQIDDLTRIVDDLLDLTRFEIATMNLRLELVDLVLLVQQVVEHQRELVTPQGVTIYVQHTAPETWAYVDRGRIAQVLNNLINNAYRYVSHTGEGQIDLAVTPYEQTVQLAVRDNGCGIEAEHLPHIFEPFYQAEGRGSGKSGLGLTVVHDLVVAHGGSLSVESTRGHGTTFKINLPRVAPASQMRQTMLEVACE